ncbi:hypothetical protein ASG67_16545 [Sphingomonas sp. Leaf339]|uniref:sensor histidine kinase n=1 Tax=Sphingomonas sp. Leaf339 TaxID=1736343 RepID=UPI0006F4F158|nr:ATP-binding protein [Sphingomonas sp. Leaf339]KQU61604.1 hypothetical protein ASG67_16545 [Sphingomonas sp. Leaf339]
MGSNARALVRAGALFAAGIVAALGWVNGLYATATLAVIAALWIGAAAHHVARRRASPPPPSPIPVGDDARERRRLAAYLDLSPAPLVALDARDRLHAVNRAARRLLGADDLVTHPPSALIDAIGAAVPGRAASVRIDTERGTHSFAILTTDLTGSEMATRVAALIDIDSEMKAVEAQALRDLLQVLSHEITNTLTPIASLARTAAQMLVDGDAAHAAVHDAVETVARRAEALHRFVDAYRSMARLPVPTLAPVQLAPLVADIARLFDTRWPAATLSCDLRAAPATVRADADQLTAAIWALLQNAAEVAVTVSLDIRPTAGGVEFMVGDDGPGILDANTGAIFQPFFTTKAEGSGVGLALARQIFRAHHGDLVLFSARPAEFLATLPI